MAEQRSGGKAIDAASKYKNKFSYDVRVVRDDKLSSVGLIQCRDRSARQPSMRACNGGMRLGGETQRSALSPHPGALPLAREEG